MRLFRKRIFPDELIELKGDDIVVFNEEYMITKWDAIRVREDLHHGVSCYFLKEGWKVSKIYDADNNMLRWYCDIGKFDYDKETDTMVFTDLLADVVRYPNGMVQVVDLDEVADMMEQNRISSEDVCLMMRCLDRLLKVMYGGKFEEVIDVLKVAGD